MFTFDVERDGFSIRPTVFEDATALRMLLPGFHNPTLGLVAIDGKHQLIVGAIAAMPTFRTQPLKGPGIALHVIEPCRRHGIGSSLLNQIEQVALSAGAEALYGAKRVEKNSAEMLGWQRLGFSPCESVEENLLPLEQFEPQLAPLVERMQRHGRIPASARIIPLYQSNLPAVLQLHLDNMGGDRGDLYRKLRGQGPDAFLPRHSRVLLLDDKVKGCILGHWVSKDTMAVDANILDPSVRGGWANAWLKLESTRVALRLGVKFFRFTTFDHYADTRRFTEKLGGMTTRITFLMMRRIRSHENNKQGLNP